MRLAAPSLLRCALLPTAICIPILVHSLLASSHSAKRTVPARASEATPLALPRPFTVDLAVGSNPSMLNEAFDTAYSKALQTIPQGAGTAVALTAFGGTYTGPLFTANGTVGASAGFSALDFGFGSGGAGSAMSGSAMSEPTAGDKFDRTTRRFSVKVGPFSPATTGTNGAPGTPSVIITNGGSGPGPKPVPESGSSIVLLSIGFIAFGVLRRVLSRQEKSGNVAG